MGKLKGKRTLSKAGANFNSAQSRKPYNPFEEKIFKEKQQIFGRPQQITKGNPGASRSQACNKRKNTLLYEYEQQHKSNSISDRRIGEKNRFISNEDKTVARYAAVRAKHKSKQLYNLESNEILTHNGITLNEIEKFEDPRSDDEDSDNTNNAFSGKLDKKFVSEVHFGGGVLSRKSSNPHVDGQKSYKDIINQLIVDSKKRKVEKQREKESTQELTDKLDSEWKDLLPLMSKQNKSLQQEEAPAELGGADKYDKYVSELRFEARGVPSDKLKTTSEIAAEEAATRETLEQERLARMQGPCFSNPTPVHRSADDLDDNCLTSFNNLSEEDDMLRYNADGLLINGPEATGLTNNEIDEEQMNLDEAEEAAEEEQSSDDDVEEDRFSDLQSDSDSDSNIDDAKDDLIKPKASIMAEPSIEPLTNASFPKSYEDFKQILDNLSPLHYNLKLSQLIQYAKSTPSRKDDINLILTSLLRYILEADLEDPLTKCNHLLPATYNVIQIDPETSCTTFIEILQELRAEYKAKKSITMGMLLWFKIVANVFSVSDFRHAVATVSVMVLEDLLDKTAVRLRSQRDVVGGLFLATLMLEFTWISKRFSPALILFLNSVIKCASKSIKNKGNKISKFPNNFLLLTTNNAANSSFPLQLNLSHLKKQPSKDSTTISDEFKITAMYVAVKLLQTAYSQLMAGEIPSRCEAFAAVTKAVEGLRVEGKSRYPKGVTAEMDSFVKMVQEDISTRKLEYLTVEKKRPKPMRLYEPNIQTIYDRKPRGPKTDKSERDKLMYKIKQERKGALREIRKDVTFLGGHRIRHQIKSDNERKAQVKKIFAEAAIQQSDLNSMNRKKKR